LYSVIVKKTRIGTHKSRPVIIIEAQTNVQVSSLPRVAILHRKETRGNNSYGEEEENINNKGLPRIKTSSTTEKRQKRPELNLGEDRAAPLLGKVAALDELVSLGDCVRDIRNQVPQHCNDDQ
jgi:hypothetical protein